MLIIHRKIGEQVLIGNGLIQVKILRVNTADGMISIGFTAPKDVDIDREEVFNRKRLQGSNSQGVKL